MSLLTIKKQRGEMFAKITKSLSQRFSEVTIFFPALFRDTYLKFSLKTTIKKIYRKKSTSQKLSTGNRTKLVTSSSSVYEQSLL